VNDQKALTEATKFAQKLNLNVFNIFQLSQDETEHCDELIKMFSIPSGSTVLDVGSGVGFFAGRLAESDPTLQVVCLNNNSYQLSCTPGCCIRMLADMHEIPVQNKEFDVVVCSYTMGFGRIYQFLQEARRVLVDGGVMWVYDMEGSSVILRKLLQYTTLPAEDFCAIAARSGFKTDVFRPVGVNCDHFTNLLEFETAEARALINVGLRAVQPVLYKMTRKS
jgi:ubiquinone/menaquinone biosynthesis C-methylase UbiE